MNALNTLLFHLVAKEYLFFSSYKLNFSEQKLCYFS